jgi:FtsP/CotA-like multicopper oxidase with cupredoxin domain
MDVAVQLNAVPTSASRWPSAPHKDGNAMSKCWRRSVLLLVLIGACGRGEQTTRSLARPCVPGSADAVQSASPNDQRMRAGTLFRDTLDLQLDIRQAQLRPEGEQGPTLNVVTFGESGRSPSVPGPLVRVPAGTTVLARVCNTLADTVWLIGLAARGDSLVAPPGRLTKSIFTLEQPGIRVYRGATREDTVLRPFGPSATLGGAIVADGEQRWGDRVLVITEWAPFTDTVRFALQLNGMSWPHTERLRYAVGDTARWIVVNASQEEHPMHLHGFHFLVRARSNALRDSVYAPERQRLAVTELLRPGESMALDWIPERAGRWLFHCHFTTHMGADQRFHMRGTKPPRQLEMHAERHAERGMAGLVMGIDVPGNPAAGLATNAPVQRQRLLVQDRPNVYPDGDPGYGYVLQGAGEPAPDSLVVPGPPIVLTRAQTAEINVVNRLATHTAVHWHGLEIESFYDGVPGWSGDNGRTTPLIAPGDSFLVRLAPPRAGTFIYHAHADELRQLGSGLFGPVVVLDPGQSFNPRTDHFLIFSMAGPNLEIATIVANNGASPTLELEAGQTHRIRIINITADDAVEMEIQDDRGRIPWRILARDGADVPAALTVEQPAFLITGAGQTADVSITPRAGNLRLTVRSFNNFETRIRVRPPD